jgi:hypothetical protein
MYSPIAALDDNKAAPLKSRDQNCAMNGAAN